MLPFTQNVFGDNLVCRSNGCFQALLHHTNLWMSFRHQLSRRIFCWKTPTCSNLNIFCDPHVPDLCFNWMSGSHLVDENGLSFKFHFATTTFKKLLFLPFYTHNILSTFYLWSRIFTHDSVPLRQEFVEDSVIFSTYFYPLWCLAWSLRHDKCTKDNYWNEIKYFLLV